MRTNFCIRNDVTRGRKGTDRTNKWDQSKSPKEEVLEESREEVEGEVMAHEGGHGRKGGLCKKTGGRDLRGRSDRKGGLCKKDHGEVLRTKRLKGGGPEDKEVLTKGKVETMRRSKPQRDLNYTGGLNHKES